MNIVCLRKTVRKNGWPLIELCDKICHQHIRDDDNSYREEEFDRYMKSNYVESYYIDATDNTEPFFQTRSSYESIVKDSCF